MFCPILFALLFPIVFAGDVQQLTGSTKDELSKHPIALVKYYAPWCGHCKALAPSYEKAATELKSNTPPVPLFEVNCDEESDMCKEANVGGYPTLKVYEHGEFAEDFTGDRSSDGIVSFMALRAGPPAIEITEKAEYEKLSEGADYSIVLQTEQTSAKEEFFKAAKKLRGFFTFYYTKHKLLDASKDTLIKLSRPKQLETKLEENSKFYEGPFKTAEIERWIRENAYGLVGIRTRKTEEFFKKPLLVVFTAVNFDRNPSNIRYYRNRMIMAAKELKTNVQFGLSDAQLYAGDLNGMGVSVKPDSAQAVIMAEDGKIYVMEDKFGVSELKKFVADFTKGSLTPFIKSEPIPEKQEGPVTKVVGKNFEDIVLDKSKDVLVEFYAPWCGHCKALKPKYEELAKKLAKEDDIVIAALDATANTFPPTFSIQGFPTIYWVPKNAKTNPTVYEGGRDVEDMLKFVAKSATNELTHYTRDGKLKQEEL